MAFVRFILWYPINKSSSGVDLFKISNTFFVAIGAWIIGFIISLWSMVAINGTFLKSKNQGTMFVAVCMMVITKFTLLPLGMEI